MSVSVSVCFLDYVCILGVLELVLTAGPLPTNDGDSGTVLWK